MKSIKEIVHMSKEDEVRLVANFQEAKSRKKFRDYLALFPVHEEILMKYTSRLEEAAEEFDHCQNCPGLAECKNQIKGYLYTPQTVSKGLVFEYRACSYQKKLEKQEHYKKNVYVQEVPKALKEATLKNVYKDDKNRLEIIKFIMNFLEHYEDEAKPKGLYLHGSFGTGKSYLIAALFNELAKREVKSAMIYFPELLRSLKESFQDDYKEKFQFIKKVPLLLLDDLGAENLTAWGRDEILGSILQYRMDEQLPTFFTSNLDLNQLEEHLSITSSGVDKVKAKRIIERIKQLTVDLTLATANRRS